MNQIVTGTIGVVLAAVSVALAHWQWRRTAGRIMLEMTLIRSDGLRYYETQPGDGVPRWKITARNLGRSTTSISRLTLITTDSKHFSATEHAEGPPFPCSVLPGHQAEWVFRSNLTYDLGRPPSSWLKPEFQAWAEMKSKLSTGRVVHAKGEIGAGEVTFAHRRLRNVSGVYYESPLSRKDIKLEIAMLSLDDQARRLGLSKGENG
jgi:hypothetical protein